MRLTKKQIKRYGRQIILKEIGEKGEEKLLKARVLVIGAGGLGSAAAYYLVAAGVGTLGLADPDKVCLSNLHRQILYSTRDVGHWKVRSARTRLQALNPDVQVLTFPRRVTRSSLKELIRPFDFIIDATDNFETKYLINETCVREKKPFSFAGVLGWEGQALTYVPGEACYQCVFPNLPGPGAVPTSADAGILGPVAGMLGTIQALEALKYILKKGRLLINQMLFVDLLHMRFKMIKIRKSRDCPVCSKQGSC